MEDGFLFLRMKDMTKNNRAIADSATRISKRNMVLESTIEISLYNSPPRRTNIVSRIINPFGIGMTRLPIVKDVELKKIAVKNEKS